MGFFENVSVEAEIVRFHGETAPAHGDDVAVLHREALFHSTDVAVGKLANVDY